MFAVYPEAGLGHPGLHPRHLHPLLPPVRQVAPDHGDHDDMMISVLCREEIASTVLEVFGVACDPWGIVVERVEVNREPSRDEHWSCQRKVSQCPYYALQIRHYAKWVFKHVKYS